MAHFLKKAFSDPRNPFTLDAERLKAWQPKYTGWKEFQDFSGKKFRATIFDAKQGFELQAKQQGGDYVSAAQQAVADRGRDLAKRSVMHVMSEVGDKAFQVADFGLRREVAAYIPKLEVPPTPWEMKLDYTPAELKAGWDKLSNMVPSGGLPVSFDDVNVPNFKPGDMAQFCFSAAENWLQSQNLPVDPRIMKAIQDGAVSDMYTVLSKLPSSLHEVTRDTLNGVSQISAVASPQFWGNIDYQKGIEGAFLTLSSLQDGVISKDEAREIGAATGAFAGGAVGSIWGPVGAAMGSALGSLVGGELGASFGESVGASSEWLAAERQTRKLQEAQAEMRRKYRELMEQRRQSEWVSACKSLREAYYELLEYYMLLTAKTWAQLEMEVGWRFGLRWFDPNPGVNFNRLLNHRAAHKNIERNCKSHTTRKEYWVKAPNYNEVRAGVMLIDPSSKLGMERVVKVAASTECHTTCPQTYGCPYPQVGGFDTPLMVGMDTYYPGTGGRVANAYAARGYPWKDPQSRVSCADLYSTSDLDLLSLQLSKLQEVGKLVLLDVQRTATVVRVEHDMWANGANMVLHGLDTGTLGKVRLEEAVKSGKNTSKRVTSQPGYSALRTAHNLNQTLLYCGLGAAGLALVDQVRRRRR